MIRRVLRDGWTLEAAEEEARKIGLREAPHLTEFARNYIAKYDVPYNPLHDAGYPSIGCTHCTRAVRAGENERAGRWAGQVKTECGLHGDAPKVVPLKLQL